MAATIGLRPIGPGDEPFLYQVYYSTREDELAQVDWSQEQKDGFVQMQFAAQHQYYQTHYTNATWDLILVDEQPAGRLYVDRWPDQIRIVDIAILPAYRNAGVGTTLLKNLLDEAANTGIPVSIHVEMFNPALRLYERLGFIMIGEQGVYYLMQWSPPLKRD